MSANAIRPSQILDPSRRLDVLLKAIRALALNNPKAAEQTAGRLETYLGGDADYIMACRAAAGVIRWAAGATSFIGGTRSEEETWRSTVDVATAQARAEGYAAGLAEGSDIEGLARFDEGYASGHRAGYEKGHRDGFAWYLRKVEAGEEVELGDYDDDIDEFYADDEGDDA